METTDHSYTIKNDPRWQQWAYAITQGTTMARRKWAGKNRPFSQSEYERGIGLLVANGILRSRSDRTNNPGFQVNRAGGWEYIQEMAHGLKLLPPPSPSYKKSLPKIRHFNHARNNHNGNLLSGVELVTGESLVNDENQNDYANALPDNIHS